MRAVIRDRHALLEVPPLEVAAYLRARNWNLVERDNEDRDRWSIWVLEDRDGSESEILLPHDPSLADYALRMADILSALEATEDRSQIEILRDIQTSTGDIVRIRADRADVYAGSVLLESGVSLVQSARDMLAASACAAIEPKAYYPARKPAQAEEYLQKAYLGQTEQGSYVITIISRVPPELRAKQVPFPFGEEEEPFQRRVTMTLARAVDKARTAAESTVLEGSMDAFTQAVEYGVSANLCDALASIGDTHDGSVSVSVSWAASRPLTEPLPSRTVFSTEMMPVIREAGRILKTQGPIEGMTIQGMVVGLDRKPGAPSGVIRVATIIGNQLRLVRVDLTDPEYHAATMAHDEERSVNLVGTMVKEGRFYFLRSVQHFSVE